MMAASTVGVFDAFKGEAPKSAPPTIGRMPKKRD